MMYQKAQQERQQQLSEAQKELDESVSDFREMLPDNKGDYTNLMQEQPSFWEKLFKINKNIKRNYENNKAVEYLGLNKEEGLNSFLHSVQEEDPNNENLKLLMEQLHANSVDELSSNSILQESLDLVGGGNWYNYEYNDNIGHLTDGAAIAAVPASRDIGNTLIKIINSQYAKKAGEIPLKSASDEEIISYIESLAGDQNKLNTLATYNGIKNNNPGILDYITEKLDDYQDYSGTVNKLVKEINECSNAGNNIDEIQTGLESANQAIEKYNDAKDVIEEIEKKSIGYMTGVQSEISSNPWVIGGAGAAAGAGLGMATESKNIFKKAKEFIATKLLGRNKNKALPSGEQIKEEKENKLEEKRKKLNVKLDKEILKVKNIENVSKEKKEYSNEKNIQNDDYEQEV